MGRDAGFSPRTFSRVFWLRALVCFTLAGVTCLIGWAAYAVLQFSEQKIADSVYESVSVAALKNTQVAFARATWGATLLAGSYSSANPSESDWPNASLNGFIDNVAQLAVMTSVAQYTFAPVLRPDQAVAWETFAFNLWDGDPQIEGGRAYLPTGQRGIWQFDPSIPFPGSIFLDDKSGDTVWGDSDTLRILLPITQSLVPEILGINDFPTPFIGPLAEKSLLCAAARNIRAVRSQCDAVLPPLALPAPNPAIPSPAETIGYQTVIISPIAIVADDGSTKAVGEIGAAFDWSELLADTVPSFVGEMDIVVEAEGVLGSAAQVFTYVFKKGAPIFKGSGDLHDTKYSGYKRTGALYPASLIGIAESSKYTITFYPRKAFYDEYESNNPILFAVGEVSLIALVSLIFLLYDFAVSRQSERQQVVLDTKRRYVRFISHEIRTPLNTVRLGLKLFDLELVASLKMLSEKSPAEAVQLMRVTIENWIQLTDDALSSTEAAVDVLNDLLNYDKIESGTLRLEFSSVPIWQVVKKTCAGFAMQAREKHVTLTLTGALWDGQLSSFELKQYQALQVVGDSMRISQVLRNLMSNAIKFTPTLGSVSVHVDWLPGALADAQIDNLSLEESQQWFSYPRHGAVRVSVTDTGAGLSPTQLLEIGAEGVQFNANQLQAGQGSGLGLFISKGICVQHGGTFEVTSQGLDCGATFSITLPLFNIANVSGYSENDSNTLRRISAESIDSLAAVENRRPQRVLVVDDATSNRKMLLRILRTKQYVCEEAENGRMAVEKYAAAVERGEPFDAILSDYEMPVMNGPDSVWEMRRLGCKCFIAGITGNVMQDDIDHYKERGADCVLSKPLDTDVFESLFRNFKPREIPYGTNLSASQKLGFGESSGSAISRRGDKVYPGSVYELV